MEETPMIKNGARGDLFQDGGRLDASQDRQAAFEESMECLARLKFQNRALFGFRQFGAKPSRPPFFSARAFLECFGACVCVRVARNFAYTEGGETHRLLLVEIERSGRGCGRCKTFRIIIYPLYRINNFGFVEYPPLLTFAREQSSLTYRNS